MLERPWTSQAGCVELLSDKWGLKCTQSTVSRALKDLGLDLQKLRKEDLAKRNEALGQAQPEIPERDSIPIDPSI